jgi:predicted nucleic acid-binding Zn ribbon protein
VSNQRNKSKRRQNMKAVSIILATALVVFLVVRILRYLF